MFCSEYDNFKFYHNDYIFHDSITKGKTEPYLYELPVVKRYLKVFPHKNRCFIDIGAHIGTTVLCYLRLYNNCIAYEPNDENHSFLCKNISENKMEDKVIINKTCVGNSFTKGSLVYHQGNNSGCYYFNENNNSGVNCIRVDDDINVFTRNDIDFIKIDVEGYELEVLKGMEKTILKNKPLIELELNGLCEKHYGVKEKDIYVYLYSLGGIVFDSCPLTGNVFFYFPNDTLCLNQKRIFCFWTGNNPITNNRKNCLETIENYTLITPENLNDYILKSHPLHEAYQYLSETHKADYLRTYFMNFYGGGYSDIKIQTGSWKNCFDIMINNNNLYACGYREIGPNGVPNENYKDKYESLIGNCSYIFRPNTEFTNKWHNCMIEILDKKLELLRNNPSKNPIDCVEHFNYTKYPISWCEMLGMIFHPICFEFKDKLDYSLPVPLFYNYR